MPRCSSQIPASDETVPAADANDTQWHNLNISLLPFSSKSLTLETRTHKKILSSNDSHLMAPGLRRHAAHCGLLTFRIWNFWPISTNVRAGKIGKDKLNILEKFDNLEPPAFKRYSICFLFISFVVGKNFDTILIQFDNFMKHAVVLRTPISLRRSYEGMYVS